MRKNNDTGRLTAHDSNNGLGKNSENAKKADLPKQFQKGHILTRSHDDDKDRGDV